MRVCGPVFDAGVDDVELEGEEVLEDVRACGWGLDGRERAKEVGHFGGDLVEEAEAGEGGEAEGPELCRECQEVSFFWKGKKNVGVECLHSRRGRGPPGRFALCGREPFGRVLASCSSSTQVIVFRPPVLSAGEGEAKHSRREYGSRSLSIHL